MTAHSPGPWRVEEDDSDTILDANGKAVMSILDVEGNGLADADARLIVAAPELLEAVRERLTRCTCRTDGEEFGEDLRCGACDKAEALIARLDGKEP